MRISATKRCQLIMGDPPRLVLTDDTTDQEMVLSAREAYCLFRAIGYFSADLGLFDEKFDVPPEQPDAPADLSAPPTWPYGNHAPAPSSLL